MIPDYEAMLEAFYGRLLKPGDVVADVGAHVGRHTVPMLKNVLPLGHVYAFEPLPECWAALTENECLRAHHENVTISQCALGAENATRDFVVAVDIPAYSGLQERHYDAPTRLERISVEVKRMDSVLCKINRLDYIKVDAEGGEFDILVGAEETLNRLGPVISFEFGLNSCQGYGVTPEHMFDYLQHSGYLIFDILGQALDREAFSNSAIQQALWDYVALPEAKQELSGLLNRT